MGEGRDRRYFGVGPEQGGHSHQLHFRPARWSFVCRSSGLYFHAHGAISGNGLTLAQLLIQHPCIARRTAQRLIMKLIERGEVTVLGEGRDIPRWTDCGHSCEELTSSPR